MNRRSPTHLRVRWAAALAVGAFTLAGCGSSINDTPSAVPNGSDSPFATTPGGVASDSPSTPRPEPSRSAPAKPAPNRPAAAPRHLVVAISVDGLNPDALARLGSVALPAFSRLAAEGAWTTHARTLYEQTNTLPNHTAMMTGRWVGGPQGTGVTFNEDNGQTLVQSSGGYIPGIFDVAHDHGLTTGLYVGKDKFNFLERSWDAAHGAPDTTGKDDGRDKIDDYLLSDTANLTRHVQQSLAEHRDDLTFFHIALPDIAGHAKGWMSAPYLRAVRASDRAIGTVLGTIDADPWLKARTTVIVTADHGGTGPSHRNPVLRADYTVPFFVWGQGVPAGVDLYSLNPRRQDPGASRPGYGGAQPIRNLDVAALSLKLLGLPGLSGPWPPGGTAISVD